MAVRIPVDVITDGLQMPGVRRFLEEHIAEMKSISPPESKHALDLDGLNKPDITFWTASSGDEILGCGALKALSLHHGEIKSMRTSPLHRGQGIASGILKTIIREAGLRGYSRLSLETGSMPFFAPARALYMRFGFNYCPPFADYRADPNSVFMTLKLKEGATRIS